MKKTHIKLSMIAICFIVAFSTSCKKDDSEIADTFVVAFENPSLNLSELNDETTVKLVYSETASTNGSINIELNTYSASYGTDFVTIPEIQSNSFTIPITGGANESSFTLKILDENTLDETSNIELTITAINYENSEIKGNSSLTINSSASLGGAKQPQIGGPNEQNQVYIDLSSGKETVTPRNMWDLGFYNGDEFRVTLNTSLAIAAGAFETNNIDEITSEQIASLQQEVVVGNFNPGNAGYIDNPDGSLTGTAIAEIKDNDNENPVYLLNLGREAGTAQPQIGDVEIFGASRGWKKIRILKADNGYTLQYADINSTTHNEVTITKNDFANFNFFSFNSNEIVTVQPEKTKWDICFSVFTNLYDGAGSYVYSDFITNNRLQGVEAYLIQHDEEQSDEYENFNFADIDQTKFQADQRSIGSEWRNVFDGIVKPNRFFIIKDTNDNYYKIKFLALSNSEGVRGYPEFTYKLLEE